MIHWFEQRQKAKEMAAYGMVVGDIHAQSKHSRILICLMKGLLVFMACYGTIDGVLSAFSIDYNHSFIIPFLFGISMFVSFFYYNKLIFYSGYILILLVFTWELIRYYLYANSGYQAIINIIYEEYSDYFKLLSVREAKEYYDNRYLTVTIALVFIGIFLALLLNVTISGYMNVFETMLITAPFIEIALYIGKKPSILSLGLLIASYVVVAILQCSRNSRMQVKGPHTKEFLRKRTKKADRFNYQGSGTAMVYILLLTGLILPLIIAGLYPTYRAEKPEEMRPSAIRELTDEYVKIFVQVGFTGFLDRYDSNGGLSDGRLGGVSSVRPDFETDLEVTYAPYNNDTVYLKAFTGNLYTGDSWYSNAVDYESVEQQSLIFTDKEREQLEKSTVLPSDMKAKMEVTNLGADTSFYYLPYVSYSDDVVVTSVEGTDGDSSQIDGAITDATTFPRNSTFSVSYAPYFADSIDTGSFEIDSPAYERYINQSCMYVPDTLSDSLLLWCKQADLPGVFSDFVGSTDSVDDTDAWRLQVADAIRARFLAEYPYTMSPGTTPYNTDFVDYFLFTQKRGYCAHFASSGTLLLRSMGIPARYAEGYCIPVSLLSQATPLMQEDLDSWYQSDSEDRMNIYGVVRVPVSDAYAHAWVEIYLDDYGWIPYEFTPPSFESDTEENAFFLSDLFSGIFSQQIPDSTMTGPDTDISMIENEDFFSGFRFSTTSVTFPVYIFLMTLLMIALCILLWIRVRARLRVRRLYKSGNYAALISLYYCDLASYVKHKYMRHAKNPLPRDIAACMIRLLPEKEAEIQEFTELTERVCFSDIKISDDDVLSYKKTCEAYRKMIANVKR